MARMFTPPHPGLTLRDDFLPALGLSVNQAAQQLDVSRVTLSRVLNGRAAVSPEMALRIEAWLGQKRVGDAHVWLAEHFRSNPDFGRCSLAITYTASTEARTSMASICLRRESHPVAHGCGLSFLDQA